MIIITIMIIAITISVLVIMPIVIQEGHLHGECTARVLLDEAKQQYNISITYKCTRHKQ